jgi:hypothetical protein
LSSTVNALFEKFIAISDVRQFLLGVSAVCYRVEYASDQKSGMLALQSFGVG